MMETLLNILLGLLIFAAGAAAFSLCAALTYFAWYAMTDVYRMRQKEDRERKDK